MTHAARRTSPFKVMTLAVLLVAGGYAFTVNAAGHKDAKARDGRPW